MSIEAANRLRYAKKRVNRGSPCMYPIAYRWISEPTPVTNRIHVDRQRVGEEPEVDAEARRPGTT